MRWLDVKTEEPGNKGGQTCNSPFFLLSTYLHIHIQGSSPAWGESVGINARGKVKKWTSMCNANESCINTAKDSSY